VTILVVGASGVLGRALVPRLIAGKHDVRCIARSASTAGLPAAAELIDADLLEDDLIEHVRGCAAVVHIATAIPTDPSAPRAWDLTARLRTTGTKRLLDAALACHVPHYVQQSIVMAYRDGGDGWLDEQAPLDDSPGRAAICRPVIEMEAMIRNVPPQAIGWTILRAGPFVGVGTAETTLIDALRAGAVVVADGGSNYLSPVHVADMASAIALTIDLAPAGSTFNIVDEPLRYGDYVDAIADLVGVARPRRVAKMPPPPSWRCTNKAAQTTLGWIPRGPIWPYSRLGSSA
jgi:nucleoside-diphosphate-sugar epimerase